MEVKRCSRCGVEKPRTEFHKYSRAKDGLYSYCKECKREALRKWKQANPEKYLEIRRKQVHELSDAVVRRYIKNNNYPPELYNDPMFLDLKRAQIKLKRAIRNGSAQ